MVWTRFIDKQSGGALKGDFNNLYIEAPEAEAKAIFRKRFKSDPAKNYTITEHVSLARATAHVRGANVAEDGTETPRDRRAGWALPYRTVEDFVAAGGRSDISDGIAKFITAADLGQA